MHVIYLLKAMANQLINRQKRSGVIITTDGMGARPLPGWAAYSATKAFDRYLALALNYEFKHRIDVLSY